MSPEMLMQPLEQTFAVNSTNNDSYFTNEKQIEGDYMYEGYTYPEGDFRPTFYNPFEIKHRRRTSRSQLKVLEKSFSENPKPNATVRRILAQQLGMTPRGVQIWFQNRRAKAKLQKRKSGFANGDGNNANLPEDFPTQSPVLFSQFFVNVQNDMITEDDDFVDSMDGKPKLNSCSQSTSSNYSSNNAENKQSNARNVATAAAASCIFDSGTSDLIFNDQQQCSIKMEEWLKLPIHPLAPVIEGTDELDNGGFCSSMSAEEWRRKSCPALGTKNNYFNIQNMSNENYNIDAYLNNYGTDLFQRRMTEPLDILQNSFIQSCPIVRSETESDESSCNTPVGSSRGWTLNIMSPLSNRSPIDFNYQSLNYSPISQQVTPMLSTCSPNPVHGQFDPPCLDFILPSTF